MTLTNEEIRSRYELLCKASQPNSAMDVKLQQELSKLESLIKNDLVALTRQGCPDNITDILSSFNHELTRFRQFCEFPQLAAKSVVGIGGGFSAGKSSFINKLIGKKCLAVEVDPTTSMPAYVLKGAEESIKAINMHDCAIDLTQEELSTLTHEEKELYGSQVGLLLKSAFICTPDFKWNNLAFLDTPGYSKPEDFECNDRTDENLARDQLNTADYILWAVPVDNGTISEQDITFLSSLNKDIPKLVILTKADKKPLKDVENIAELVKSTLGNRGISVLDVVPFSRRNNSEHSLFTIKKRINSWDVKPVQILFSSKFEKLIVEYKNYIINESDEKSLRLENVNNILAFSEDLHITESANTLLSLIKREECTLEYKLKCFEKELKSSINKIKTLDLRFLIFQGNVVSLDVQYKIASDDNCDFRYLLAQCDNISTDVQRKLANDEFTSVRTALASNIGISTAVQHILAKDEVNAVRSALASNISVSTGVQQILAKDKDNVVRSALAMNASTSSKVHRFLIKDVDKVVRCSLAMNQGISHKFQRALANDKEIEVRKSIMLNPNYFGK